MRTSFDQRPDFQRFVRAVTTGESGPVPLGDMFADFETVGHYLKEKVFDYAQIAADPDHKMSESDLQDGLKYIDQTIRFCKNTGWDYVYSFSVVPSKGLPACLLTIHPLN